MKPKPYEIVESAVVVEGYKAKLAEDIAHVATLIHAAEMGSPAQTFSEEEIEALRIGSVTALIIVSELLKGRRIPMGCESVKDVSEHIVRCAAAAHKQLVVDKG